jgi:uncharacterized membrane protein (Fun14 family)
MTEEGEIPTGPVTYEWCAWKIGLVVFAGLLVVAGGVLALAGSGEEDDSDAEPSAIVQPGGGGTPGAEGLFPTDPPDVDPDGTPEMGEDGAASPDSLWSPALLRGGISFFAAFVLALAFRAFLKLALIFAGIWVASLFLLSSAGWLEVHWSAIDASFTGWASAVGDQFESFTRFVTGSLPSAGMAGLGLYAGIRRK